MLNAMMIGNSYRDTSNLLPEDTGPIGILIDYKRVSNNPPAYIYAYRAYPYPREEYMGEIDPPENNLASISLKDVPAASRLEIILYDTFKFKKLHFMADEVGTENMEFAECFYDSVVTIEGKRCYKYIGGIPSSLESFMMSGIGGGYMRGYRLVLFYSM